MPAWKAPAPGAIPLHNMSRLIRHPEGEVVRLLSLLVHGNACAGVLPFQIQPREVCIPRKFGRVKYHPDLRAIGEPSFLQALHQLDLFFDVLRCPADDVRPQDVHLRYGIEEMLLVEAGDLPRRFSLPARTDFQLVLALVRVRRHVSHVGDIHNVPDPITGTFEDAAEQIGGRIRAQVPDVGEVVNGHAAAIHTDLWRRHGTETLHLARGGIVQAQF